MKVGDHVYIIGKTNVPVPGRVYQIFVGTNFGSHESAYYVQVSRSMYFDGLPRYSPSPPDRRILYSMTQIKCSWDQLFTSKEEAAMAIFVKRLKGQLSC